MDSYEFVVGVDKREQDEYSLGPEEPVESALFGWQMRLHSLFDGAVEIPIPGVKWRVILNVANLIFARRPALGERERVVAFPIRSAIATSPVEN